MLKFIVKRIGTMLVAMFMIILLTFTLMHAIPGGPFTNPKGMSEEVLAAMEAKYGLDQPMPVQFVNYLGNLLHGDLGPSYKYTGKTVNDFIATGAPVSAKLYSGGAEKQPLAGYAAYGSGDHRCYDTVLCHRLGADLCVCLQAQCTADLRSGQLEKLHFARCGNGRVLGQLSGASDALQPAGGHGGASDKR